MATKDEWKIKPISYHLSTIGINDVFCTKPVQTKSENCLEGSKEEKEKELELELEFTGAIKVNPEDFIVREIGGMARLNRNESGLSSTSIANLTDATSLPPENDSANDNADAKPFHNNPQFPSTNSKPEQPDIEPVAVSVAVAVNVVVPPLIHVSSAKEAVEQLLTRAESCAEDGTHIHIHTHLKEKMRILSEEAASDLDRDDASNEEHYLIIPPITDTVIIELDGTDSSHASQGVRNRGTFHKTLKLAFPLLKSSTLSAEESLKEANKARKSKVQCDDDTPVETTLRYLKVEKDSTFKCLIPHLLFPQRDLTSLYQFRNKGCTVFTKGRNRDKGGRKVHGNGKKRKHESEAIIDHTGTDSSAAIEKEEALLYLKPTIQREQRKDIHHLIAKCYRDFQTGTKGDVQYDEGDENTHGVGRTTTAITIQWSRRAQDAALKRKNKGMKKEQKSHTHHTDTHTHTLCIVKKRRQEHLSLINHLAAALKCRQSDIGLAGIKDTQAVTYQYCTLRNISPFRARKANEYLKLRHIELGNFERVSVSLNQGDSKGNNFEITLRDIKRVETKIDSDGVAYERFVPCQRSHAAAMVDRVRQSGFINFFGEQRIGEAGPESEVGTRSSDIGRLMLHEDFAGAIDLLMKGRNKRRGGDFIENEEARKMRDIYFTSDGDVDLTLSAFPRGNGLARERTVLRGLKRYGKDKPLDALKCLNFNVRMFWINAYQSLLWNKMASERLLRLGTKPAIGDLYMDANKEINVVTETNLSDIDLYQIVLPLPGYRTRYPENIIGNLYAKAMEEDGVKFVQDAVSEATAKGSYRPLVVSCDDLTWEEVVSEQGNVQMQTDDDDAVNVIKFKFSLRSGSYATMCLREIMSSTVAR